MSPGALPGKDLRGFLARLEAQGLLARVVREVDPAFELMAVAKKLERTGRTALFERVKNTACQVVTNVHVSRAHLAAAFGCTPADVVREFVRRRPDRIEPVLVSDGPVQEVVRTGGDADPAFLPLILHCEKDAGPYITAGTVVARDPETGRRNVSINRMYISGGEEFGIRMMAPQHLGILHGKAERAHRPLDVAVVIGNHPFEMVAAATTLSLGEDEYALSSAFRGAPLPLVRCRTVPLEIPAFAEIVLEGEVLADVRKPEGPFGDFMQYYVPVMDNHVFRLTAITHRHRPIFQTIQASSLEDVHLLALSREAQIYAALVAAGADVVAVSLVPMIFAAIVSIRKRFEGEPKNLAAAAFGAYAWLKWCIVVDHDVDVFDIQDVWWAIATRCNLERGQMLLRDALGFPRDPYHLHQSKMALDATIPLGEWHEFERKRVPGEEAIRVENYVTPSAGGAKSW